MLAGSCLNSWPPCQFILIFIFLHASFVQYKLFLTIIVVYVGSNNFNDDLNICNIYSWFQYMSPIPDMEIFEQAHSAQLWGLIYSNQELTWDVHFIYSDASVIIAMRGGLFVWPQSFHGERPNDFYFWYCSMIFHPK